MGLRFNPKREARPSQTSAGAGLVSFFQHVSIPNGKPGPLRLVAARNGFDLRRQFQSQTGSQALSDPVRDLLIQTAMQMFQSQTGSQALSDNVSRKALSRRYEKFQSQTGSQALSDANLRVVPNGLQNVSIPNGKPGPLRLGGGKMDRENSGISFNPKREARPSQTSSTAVTEIRIHRVSIPNGKPGPLRPRVCRHEAKPWRVSIPNGKPGPLRHTLDDMKFSRVRGFNPKREARPSQT